MLVPRRNMSDSVKETCAGAPPALAQRVALQGSGDSTCLEARLLKLQFACQCLVLHQIKSGKKQPGLCAPHQVCAAAPSRL